MEIFVISGKEFPIESKVCIVTLFWPTEAITKDKKGFIKNKNNKASRNMLATNKIIIFLFFNPVFFSIFKIIKK